MFCLPTDWPSIIEVHLITGLICTSNRYLRDLLLSSSQSVCVTFTNYDVIISSFLLKNKVQQQKHNNIHH